MPLLLSPDGDAFECVAANGRFLLGVGVGKIVSAGTDIGLSAMARELFHALVLRAIEENLKGELRFVQVERAEHASESAEKALLFTAAGDLVFFLMADHASSEAMKGVLHDLCSPPHICPAVRNRPGFG
jgi:hypothetical protein